MRRKTTCRRCEYCQGQVIEDTRKCTCSLNKSRGHHSATSYRKKYINSSLLTHNRELSYTQELSILLADNGHLKAENNRLRRDVERLHATYNTTNETILQDKLYQSNKTLQDTILKLDAASRANKELEEKLNQVRMQNEQLKIERYRLSEQVDKYKMRLKKCMPNLNSVKHIEAEPLSSKGRHGPDVTESLLEKYTEMVRTNNELQAKNQELQDELNNIRNVMLPDPTWARKTAKKINSIYHNITKIEENHEELHIIKSQMYKIHAYFKGKVDIVLSCQYFLQLQFVDAIRHNFSNLSLNFVYPMVFPLLNEVCNRFCSADLREIILNLDISEYLSRLLNGVVATSVEMLYETKKYIDFKMNKTYLSLRNIYRKLNNLTKLIANIKMRSKTERSRMRHLSKQNSLDLSKENFNSLNMSTKL